MLRAKGDSLLMLKPVEIILLIVANLKLDKIFIINF